MSYDDFMSTISNSNPDEWNYDDELGLFILQSDISISILSDRSDYDGDEGFYEDWATNFTNPNAVRKKYFFRYNGIIIYTFYTVRVDGSRSDIPYPTLNGMTITEQQYNFGKIVNSIHGYDFNEYLNLAGITVV